MIWILVGLGVLGCVISAIVTRVMIGVSHRVGALDTGPMDGQIKDRPRAIPNTGGVGIALGIIVPLVAGLVGVMVLGRNGLPDVVSERWEDLEPRLGIGWALALALGVIHVLGLIDDRRPLGPWVKLLVMIGVSIGFVVSTETRLLTMLDGAVGGAWLSVALSVVWIVVVTNALNFIDNTDGLSAGVAAISGVLFLVAAALGAQWFIGAVLALMVGSCAGFLVFNFPPAKVFMGDGGSLVIGFVLSITTIRTTYIAPGTEDPGSLWYALLMPIAVLAVPLYDSVSVTILRLSQGKSPMVGDLQHFSHRLLGRGLGVRRTLLVIYALTAASGVSGLLLTRSDGVMAPLILAQLVLIVGVLGMIEFGAGRSDG